MGTLTHSLVTRQDSWHVRWYRCWISLGGTPAPYKENLCRYVRILLIWAPLRWFFFGRVMCVPPWVVVLIADLFAFTGVVFYVWPHIGLKALEVIGLFIGAVVTLVAIIGTAIWWWERDEEQVKRVLKWSTSPIWVVPYILGLGLYHVGKWVFEPHKNRLQAIANFIETYVLLEEPFGMSVIYVILGLIAVGFYFDPVRTGAAIGGILIGLTIIIGGVAAGEKIKERRKMRRSKSRAGRAYEGVADTIKLGVTYLGTKKRGSRICPFIEFEDTQPKAA